MSDLPATFDQLQNAVENTANSFILGLAWVEWINHGVDREAFGAVADSGLFQSDLPPIFPDDDGRNRHRVARNLYQFLLCGWLLQFGSLVEHYVKVNKLVAPSGRDSKWSELPDPVYVLRIIRNSIVHEWKINSVHRTVTWGKLTFYKNTNGVQTPAGYRPDDRILPLLAKNFGPEENRRLQGDVISALGNYQTSR